MSKKKRLVLMFSALLLGGIILWILYAPRPIVSDVSNSRVVLLLYNPCFQQDIAYTDVVVLREFDEAAVLDCPSRYTEQRTFRRATRGFLQENMQFNIIVNTGNDSKTIVLGNTNHAYETYGAIQYRFVDAASLRLDLLEILAPDLASGTPFGEETT